MKWLARAAYLRCGGATSFGIAVGAIRTITAVARDGGLPQGVAALTAAYHALANGSGDPTAITALANTLSPHGLFTGHLAQGSRELDLVVERMDAADVG